MVLPEHALDKDGIYTDIKSNCRAGADMLQSASRRPLNCGNMRCYVCGVRRALSKPAHVSAQGNAEQVNSKI